MTIWKRLRPALVCFGIMTVVCGVLYTLAITGVSQLLFSKQANGSTIEVDNQVVGSKLIGQEFTGTQYLIGRPMVVSNLSPTSEEQTALVEERVSYWKSLDTSNTSDIPADLVTASASGVDPYITPEAANYQVSRIAKERNMSESDVQSIIKKNTTNRFLGIFGEKGVNVLAVNLALDGLSE